MVIVCPPLHILSAQAGLQYLACKIREEIKLVRPVADLCGTNENRYDGWESRRHNATPPDHVTIRLGPAAGVVAGVEVDTAFFTGNYAEEIEVLGAFEPDLPADVFESNSYNKWFSLVSRRQCGPSRRHAWFVDPEAKGKRVTHVRLHMFPDGGIARFRLYGRAEPVWPSDPMVEVELSAAVNGGVAIAASDEHFGRRGNLLLPGRGKDMGDGWETKRSRGKGHVDWTIVRLGARGQVGRVVVDTMHFRGNFPRGVRVEALDAGALKEGDEDGGKMVEATDERWIEVVSTQPCEKDKEHEYTAATGTLKNCEGKAFTHLKIIMEPDGGIKRFRVFGTRSAEST